MFWKSILRFRGSFLKYFSQISQFLEKCKKIYPKTRNLRPLNARASSKYVKIISKIQAIDSHINFPWIFQGFYLVLHLPVSMEASVYQSQKENLIASKLITQTIPKFPQLIFLFQFSSCTSRYIGNFCEHHNPCYNGPRCQNGGTCMASMKDGFPTFWCDCPIGFSASLCEIHVPNVCDSSPCINGGTCRLKTLHDFKCVCAEGYSGKKSFFGSLLLLPCSF